MLPTIGFIVAATGIVICLYVMVRSIALAQHEKTKTLVTIASLVLAVLSGLGAIAIGGFAADLNRQAERATEQTFFAPR